MNPATPCYHADQHAAVAAMREHLKSTELDIRAHLKSGMPAA